MKHLQTNSKKERNIWWALLIVSLISLLSVIEIYISGGSAIRKPKWVELIIIPFYFTIQSNFLAFFISALVCFKIIKNHQKLRILTTFMAVNLIVTFLVYWAFLFPLDPNTDLFGWIRNITLHTLTPILAVAVFLYKYTQTNHNLPKRPLLLSSLLHLIYPAIYLISVIALYFILGADQEDAVYDFLKIKAYPIAFVIYIFGIAIFYFGLTILFIYISNLPRIKKER